MTPLDARRAHDVADLCDRLFASLALGMYELTRPTPAMLWLERAAAELERQRETHLPPRGSEAAKRETDK